MEHLNTFIIFFCCICVVLCETEFKCKKNEDCGADECCVVSPPFTTSYCKKLMKKGGFCFENQEEYKLEDKYKYMCPCEEGLKCETKPVTGPFGVVIYRKSRCA
ncbi:U3-aranetoxin-Ce1a-like [Argiope bruennichi]|uniref:U3-aranetoxin-Ce1a-like n=1 Tax=Argiope bruennichi TaxID=94029 RepID=UPI0024957F42|nr:U3-aranetoxin-Ce1a-like [Argiope bruennichi]